MAIDVTQFKQMLNGLISQADQLYQLSCDIQAALVNHEAQKLQDLTEKQTQAITTLQSQFIQYQNALKQTGADNLTALSKQLADPQAQQLAALDEQFKKSLARSFQTNAANNSVIQINIRNNRQLLNLIKGNTEPALYTPSGQLEKS